MSKFFYDEEAYKLLKECSDSRNMSKWNQYRKDNDNAPINLRFIDLRRFYLVDANLSNVDFRGTDLNFSRLMGTDVRGSNISMNYLYGLFILSLLVAFFTIMILNKYLILHDVFPDLSFLLADMIVLAVLGVVLAVLGVGNMGIYMGFFYPSAIVIVSEVIVNKVIVNKVIYIDIIFATFMVGFFVVSAIFIYFEFNKKNQKAVAKANNPTECIGFDQKYLETDALDIMRLENLELAEELKNISDEEAIKSIKARIAQNEKDIVKVSKRQTTKESFELRVESLLKEIKKPYQYLQKHIVIQYSLILSFALMIMGLIGVFIQYGEILYSSRERTFIGLFPNATNKLTALPDFGTIFGVMFYYGTPIFIGIAIIAYLFSKINHSLDKIMEYQAKEKKINEVISIIKVKNILGFKNEKEFKSETNKILNQLKDSSVSIDKPKDEPKVDIINPVKETIKEVVGTKK